MEKILRGLTLFGCFVLYAGGILWVTSNSRGNGWYEPLALALVEASAAIAILGFIATALASSGRRAVVRRDIEAMTLASAETPAVSQLPVDEAIANFRWTLDYTSHLRVALAWMFGRRLFIFLGVFLVIILVLSVETMFVGVRPGTSIQVLVRMRLPFVGLLFGALFVELAVIFAGSQVVTRMVLRKHYRNTPIQNFGLILDPDGVRIVAGNIVNTIPWKRLTRIMEIEHSVYLIGATFRQIIPSYAFHTAGDAKAFAATARALKRGKRPPAHDWSSYVLKEQAPESVWPPPILPR